MNKPLQLIAMLIIVALVAAAACYVSARLFGPLRPQPGVSGHEWIHKQLGLSPEEHKALEPIESKFAERKRNLMGEIRRANKVLAVPTHAIHGSFLEIITTEMYGWSASRSRLAMPSAARVL